MTRSLYTRNSLFMRVVSTTIALAFTLSLSGTGFAVPQTSQTPDGSAVSTSVPDPGATQESAGGSEASASDPSVEAQPTTGEPPQAPAAAAEAPATDSSVGVTGDTTAPAESAPVALSTAAAVAAPAALALPFATFQDADWEAYRISPPSQIGWAKSNLGEYRENDWIPVRVFVTNGGASDIRIPGFQIVFDYLNTSKNAIAVDDAKEFRFITVPGTTVGALPPDTPYPNGTSDIGSNFSSSGSGAQFKITMATPSSDLVVPAGRTGVIYFQVHLALSLYWEHQNPMHEGAMAYPGSSSQGYFSQWNGADVAKKTISLPVGPAVAPQGVITGYKFNDLNHDGVRQAGEPFLSGWDFTIVYNNQFTFTKTATSDVNGMFTFTGLPEGNYSLSETAKPLWTNSTPLPMSIDLGKDATFTTYVGNYVPDVTKTWSLSIGSLPVGASAYVTYLADGVSKSTNLTGSGPFTADVSLPVGTTISNVEWWVHWNGLDIKLGSSSGETLSADHTNPFTYTSAVSGMKYEDADGSGSRGAGEAGLGGWTILLKRVVGAVETPYAQTITAANGTYSFADVIPGTYKVYEVLQSGWYQMQAPAGTFTVANGSVVSGLDFGNLFVNSGISIDKSGPAYAHVGDLVPYTIVVTNTGNYTLTGVQVTDTLLGLIGTIPTMAPGQSVTYHVSRVVLASDPDPVHNVATALGTDVLGRAVSASDSHDVDILKPAITVVKTASPTMAVRPAGIEYTYVVTNTGEDPLSSVTLSDDHLGALPIKGTLAAGESVTVNASTVLTDSTTNIATVSGTDIGGKTVSDTDSAHVSLFSPSVSIVKSAAPTVILPGGLVQYTYLVTNTGDIALHDLMVTDDVLGSIGSITMLAPAAQQTLTITVPVGVDTTNIGTVVGYYGTQGTEFYGSVTASSSAVVDVVHPAILVEKSGAPNPVISGGTVTYSFKVTNTGDVALFNIGVVDDKLGSIGVIPELAAGAFTTLTKSTVLTVTTTNVVTAAGVDAYGHPVSDTDNETVTVYHPNISVDKVAAPTTILSGEQVTYTYTVTNTGDITLTNVHITDDKIPGIIAVVPSTLAPGQTGVATATSNLLVSTLNIGTAHGTYGTPGSPFGGEVTAMDDAEVRVISPAIQVVKTAAPSPVVNGTTVTYTFTVTNTGDVPLTNISVDDDKLGHIGDIASLALGESQMLTKSGVLTVTTTNIVTATGTDPIGNPVSDTDTATVPVYNPRISIVKTAAPVVTLPNGNVLYTYLVTNIGDIELHNVTVVDDKLGPIGSVASLAPGAQAPFATTVPIAADVTNIATVTGSYGVPGTDFFGTVGDESSASVDVIHPSILVEKSASPSTVIAGTEVTYTFKVTNTGDVPLVDVSVDDNKLGHIGDIASLAAGASQTLTKSGVLNVTTTNVVTAVGDDPLGNPVSDTDTVTVPVFNPAIALDKSVSPTVILSGETVAYKYVVTNTGDIALQNVRVTDDKLGVIGTIASLAPLASGTLTKSATIAADTTNIGTAIGDYGDVESDFSGSVSATDSAAVDVVAPAIGVTKTPSATSVVRGESVTYTYVVTNKGDVPLVNVGLVDDKLGSVGTLGSLAVGASSSFTKTTPLTVATTNTVTASAVDRVGHPVSASASAFVDVFAPFTDTAVTKTADKTTAKPGDTVTYTLTYRVTTGDVVNSITLTDDYDERYMTPVDLAGGSAVDGKITWIDSKPLAVGETRTITYKMKVSDSMPTGTTSLKNVVVINPFGDTDTWTVTVAVNEPFLPFTGGEWMLLALFAALAAAAGGVLIRLGRETVS